MLVAAAGVECRRSSMIEQKIAAIMNKSHAFVVVLHYCLISRNSAGVMSLIFVAMNVYI
jgi:hypothetical protein